MQLLESIVVFLFGSVIGSFLNVVILRYRSGRTLGGRSACMTCSKTLSWFELIPIASFATQGGKCTKCRTRISWQYPLVEALTGFIFVALFFRFEYLLSGTPALFAVLFGYYAILFCLLIILSVYDIRHKILPDGISFLFAAITFLGLFFIQGDAIIIHLPTASALIAGFVLPLPFSLLWLASRGRWMGLGDAKLMIGLGWMLGFSAGSLAILLSFWIGAIVGVLFLLLAPLADRHTVSLKTAIPFGPFLALSGLIVFFLGLDFVSFMSLFAR